MTEVARIELRRRREPSLWALVDLADLERVQQYRWHALILPHATYARSRLGTKHGKGIYLHRFVLGAPADMVVDHRDHDGLNNRRSNLRLGTTSLNLGNQRILTGGTSPYKGVHWDAARGRWRVSLGERGANRRELGRFDSEIEAAMAYDAAAREAYGEFALVNFPDGRPDLAA